MQCLKNNDKLNIHILIFSNCSVSGLVFSFLFGLATNFHFGASQVEISGN